jgi:hypothetical protein
MGIASPGRCALLWPHHTFSTPFPSLFWHFFCASNSNHHIVHLNVETTRKRAPAAGNKGVFPIFYSLFFSSLFTHLATSLFGNIACLGIKYLNTIFVSPTHFWNKKYFKPWYLIDMYKKLVIAIKILGWSGVSNTSKISWYLANHDIQNKVFYILVKHLSEKIP